MGDVMTDNLLDRLWNDRKLAFRDRRDLLTQDADPDLARDILADGLNRLEAMIVLALALDWPPGQPTAKDLGRVLKVRTSPRLVKNSVQEDRGRPEPDIETQLEWLEDKDWVRAVERADGEWYWELVEVGD